MTKSGGSLVHTVTSQQEDRWSLHPGSGSHSVERLDVLHLHLAVLSQRPAPDKSLHPFAFFSDKLSSAENNYDVGNGELLTVKMALEEWWHMLEGAEQPFVVWTDHKNLSYIQLVERLNYRHARWALFFEWYNFTLT